MTEPAQSHAADSIETISGRDLLQEIARLLARVDELEIALGRIARIPDNVPTLPSAARIAREALHG